MVTLIATKKKALVTISLASITVTSVLFVRLLKTLLDIKCRNSLKKSVDIEERLKNTQSSIKISTNALQRNLFVIFRTRRRFRKNTKVFECTLFQTTKIQFLTANLMISKYDLWLISQKGNLLN